MKTSDSVIGAIGGAVVGYVLWLIAISIGNDVTTVSRWSLLVLLGSAVLAACAVGVPDEKVGERIKAFVVLKDDVKGVTGYELIHWCREHLASYKVPNYIEFRDMLPKSKVGKLLRRELRQEERKRFEE